LGVKNENNWVEIDIDYAPYGTSYTGTFTDSPSDGIYWYGIHVIDTASQWTAEDNPVKGTVNEE